MEDYLKFLKEYSDLCKKYKMGLRGCGCCGSPYLEFGIKCSECINDINYNSELDEVFIGSDGSSRVWVKNNPDKEDKYFTEQAKLTKTVKEYIKEKESKQDV